MAQQTDADDEQMPFPTDEAGNPDYEAAAEEMGLAGSTPHTPTYISDGAEVHAVVGVEPTDGDVLLAGTNNYLSPATWEVGLQALWNDWVHGELLFRRREFLYREEDTYCTEGQVAVDRRVLEALVDGVDADSLDVDTALALADVEDALDGE